MARKPPVSLPAAATSVSISQPPTDALSSRLADGLQAQALSVLHGLQLYTEGRPAAEREQWGPHQKALQGLIDALHAASPTESSSGELTLEEGGILDPARVAEFGALLLRQRTASKVSRNVLASRAGLSRNTILNLEAGKHNPTHSTVMRLLAVPELALRHDDIPWRQATEDSLGAAPNCWIAPGYDPIKMFVDLITLLNGQGGSIEQTYAYLDPKSALNWYTLSNHSAYATQYRENMPLRPLAAKILQSAGQPTIDFIALGAVDGKQEVRLLLQLLELASERGTRAKADISLYLLDISQPLLSEAYRHASESLTGQNGVTVWAVQGNFHHLPRYTQLHYAPQRAHRRRLVTMFGYTLGNLDNEPSFFRHCLVGFAPGDMLLLDINLAQADASKPDEVRRHDSALQRDVRPSHIEWLGGPLMRYCNGAAGVSMRYALETNCPVPGSYALDTMATVRLSDGRDKLFSVFRFKRYDPTLLARLLGQLGWDVVVELPYGPAGEPPVGALLLFRKSREIKEG